MAAFMSGALTAAAAQMAAVAAAAAAVLWRLQQPGRCPTAAAAAAGRTAASLVAPPTGGTLQRCDAAAAAALHCCCCRHHCGPASSWLCAQLPSCAVPHTHNCLCLSVYLPPSLLSQGNSKGDCYVFDSESGERVCHVSAIRVSGGYAGMVRWGRAWLGPERQKEMQCAAWKAGQGCTAVAGGPTI